MYRVLYNFIRISLQSIPYIHIYHVSYLCPNLFVYFVFIKFACCVCHIWFILFLQEYLCSCIVLQQGCQAIIKVVQQPIFKYTIISQVQFISNAIQKCMYFITQSIYKQTVFFYQNEVNTSLRFVKVHSIVVQIKKYYYTNEIGI